MLMQYCETCEQKKADDTEWREHSGLTGTFMVQIAGGSNLQFSSGGQVQASSGQFRLVLFRVVG